MPTIFETRDFTVKVYDKPHHSRENGGHIVVSPKKQFTHRYEMPLPLATDLMHLTMIVGEAFTNVMRTKSINIVRINYQDNGNWAYKKAKPEPHLHIHLYARTSNEKHPENDPRFQAFPDALVFPDPDTGYYDSFQVLTDQDCLEIRDEVLKLYKSEKYKDLDLDLRDVN